MNDKVKAALDEIQRTVTENPKQRLTPAIFSHVFGPAASAHAFRMAKERGLIEVDYIGGTGTPVYKKTGEAPSFPVTVPADAQRITPARKVSAPICPVCRCCIPIAAYGGWVCATSYRMARGLLH